MLNIAVTIKAWLRSLEAEVETPAAASVDRQVAN
jgi:hypothetical protein